MNIYVKDTDRFEDLKLIDPKSGCCFAIDLIANHGSTMDGSFVWSDDLRAYITDQETLDWWYKVINDQQAIQYRIFELSQEYGTNAVYIAIEDVFVGSCDLEDEAAYINKALDEAFVDVLPEKSDWYKWGADHTTSSPARML